MSDVLERDDERTSFGRRGEASRPDLRSFDGADADAPDDGWDEDEPVETPRGRSRGARRPTVVFLNFLMTCGVLGALALGGAALHARATYERPGPLAEDVNFVVREGASFSAVASELERRGIISDAQIFGYAAKITGRDRAIKTGEFAIPAGASMASVMDELIDGKPVEFRVTIPEGFTVHQALARVASHPELTGDMPDEEIPEGMLAAETISFARGEKRSTVVARLRALQEERLAKAWAARSDAAPLDTPDNLLTLASLVEKETAIPEERRDVAAVYANRIRQNWHLNADPTVIYGVYGGKGLPPGKSITRSDLRDDNLYNTYILRGLPAGPVAIPGEASLMAAADPSDLDAMFFVADGTGGHIFAKTLEEHNRNVAKWRKIERGELPRPVAQEEGEPASSEAPATVAVETPLRTDEVEEAAGAVAALAAETSSDDAGSVAVAGEPAPGTPTPLMRPR